MKKENKDFELLDNLRQVVEVFEKYGIPIKISMEMYTDDRSNIVVLEGPYNSDPNKNHQVIIGQISHEEIFFSITVGNKSKIIKEFVGAKEGIAHEAATDTCKVYANIMQILQ